MSLNALILLICIITFVFTQKRFYYVLGVAPAICFGLAVATFGTQGETVWTFTFYVEGATIAIIGIACLWTFATWGLGELRKNPRKT